MTVWANQDAFAEGTDERGVPNYLQPQAGLLLDWTSRRYRTLVSIDNGCEDARIMRVYCASVAVADRERWEQRAADAAAALALKAGILGVQVGVGLDSGKRAAASAVIALSLWRDWDSVIAATGGHLDRLLLDTELVDLERPVSADHYQLLDPDRLRA